MRGWQNRCGLRTTHTTTKTKKHKGDTHAQCDKNAANEEQTKSDKKKKKEKKRPARGANQMGKWIVVPTLQEIRIKLNFFDQILLEQGRRVSNPDTYLPPQATKGLFFFSGLGLCAKAAT
jgi:hypothetical protein